MTEKQFVPGYKCPVHDIGPYCCGQAEQVYECIRGPRSLRNMTTNPREKCPCGRLKDSPVLVLTS